MLLSIANAGPRNVESVRTSDLLPQALQANAKTFVELLEYYYEYLNTAGLPSNEIGSISSLKDIDVVSTKYLDQIEELIGKSIPNSQVLNRIELYKIIVRYYNTRGSEDSIHTFFKIFFDEIVKIVYPKEQLFNLSGGLGAWSGDAIIAASEYEVLLRQLSDETDITIGGITYDAIATDGGGQLVSVKYKEADAESYEIAVDYSNGVTTITPGGKSRILVDSVVLSDGFVNYAIAPILYFSGFGIDGRPTYSEQIDYVSEWVGTPSRIEWDGEQWEFTIGSPDGDVFTFYSEEDVADPSLVTAWLYGWASLILPITGSITAPLTFAPAVNAQIFDALLNTTGFADDVFISADVLAAEWLTEYVVTPRAYLSSNYLPSDAEVGTLAIVNGGITRPFVIGRSTIVDGDLVWQRYFTEVWEYQNHRSFASDDYKIFDGYYWQDYSYVIRSDVDSQVWIDEYRKFVHPAGLKMFSAIAIEIVLRNEWYGELDYTSSDLNTDDSWMQALIPPHNRDPESIGYHTPKYQPGYLRDRVLKYIFKYILPNGMHDSDLTRLVIFTFKTIFKTDVRTSYVRAQYQISEKFIDPCKIGEGWLSKVIGEAEEPYSVTNSCKIYNISSFIGSDNIFDYSFYDAEEGAGSGVWSGSSYDIAEGAGSGAWSGSSYENL